MLAALLGTLAWAVNRWDPCKSGWCGSLSQLSPPKEGAVLSFGAPWLENEERIRVPEGFRLRMPVPSGVVVLCTQGNGSSEGRTHSFPQNYHALDFANRVLDEVPIVAAAPGVVAYTFADAGTDPDGGAGYGNQVRVLHGDGLFTEYAHLDRVFVKKGDWVGVGQPLGTMGRTGLAGDRHVHFSLHRGAIEEPGLPDTIPIPELVTREVGTPGGFFPRASSKFRCSLTGQPFLGALYTSENDGASGLARLFALELSPRTAEAERQLQRSVARRARLWHFSTAIPRTTTAAAQYFLEPLLAEDDADPVIHYAWAVEVELRRDRFEAALRHLERARELNQEPRFFEPWIEAWVENQAGAIAVRQGHREAGEQHFAKAFTLLPMPVVAEFAALELGRASTADPS